MGKTQRDPKRERFWREALRRQKGSGLTVRAFCAREEMAETAFHAWRRILRERDAERWPAPAFVQAVVREDQSGAAADIVIDLRGGRVMRLPASMPVEQLVAVVRAVEGGP